MRKNPKQPADGISQEDAKKVERKIVANILSKIQGGKTPTASELKVLREFERSSGVESPAEEWVSSYRQLGDIFGCHEKSFPRWRQTYQDCPRPRDNGQHHVPSWRDWFKKHPEIRGVGDITAEMAMLELEDMREKVRKAVHLNDVREKLYVKVSDYCAQIGAVNGKAKAYLRQKLEFEAPSYLANQPAATVRVLLKRVVDEICVTLSELEKDLAI